jgi:hypothetical protein
MLKDLLIGPSRAEPPGTTSSLHVGLVDRAASPDLGTLLRPAIRVAGKSLPAAMNALAKGAVAAPRDADLTSNTVTFEPRAPAERPEVRRQTADDAREMAARLGDRRRAMEASGTPDVRKLARVTAYQEHLLENPNG